MPAGRPIWKRIGDFICGPLPSLLYESAVWISELRVGQGYLVSDGKNKYSVPFDLIEDKVSSAAADKADSGGVLSGEPCGCALTQMRRPAGPHCKDGAYTSGALQVSELLPSGQHLLASILPL